MSITEMLAKYGKPFANLNREKIGRGKPKVCFYNTWSLVANERKGLTYVEGYCNLAPYGLPILHAFAINQKGVAFDPTWKPNTGHVYHGIPLKIEFVWECFDKHGGSAGSVLEDMTEMSEAEIEKVIVPVGYHSKEWKDYLSNSGRAQPKRKR